MIHNNFPNVDSLMLLSVVLILLIVLFCGLATVFCPNTSGVFLHEIFVEKLSFVIFSQAGECYCQTLIIQTQGIGMNCWYNQESR